MKIFRTLLYSIVVITLISILPSGLYAQGTGITYQGHVLANGAPMNGAANFTFTLYTNSQGGSSLAGPVTNLSVPVTNGLFTAQIDFGSGIYTGASSGGYWLEIGVRGNGDTNFGTLSPRQQLTPTPFAVTAVNLANVAAYDSVDTFNYGTVGGGYLNSSTGGSGTVGGGQANTNSAFGGTIGGGLNNANFNSIATVAGGEHNSNLVSGASILGGYGNTTSNVYASIGGGYQNYVSGQYSMIGGGKSNTNSGVDSVIAGGYVNTVSGQYTTVGGGFNNVAATFNSTVSGGQGNGALLNNAAVGGGFGNTASGNAAAIPGGAFNSASGCGAIVAGGESNNATGDYSFAAGAYANAAHNDSFVWSDGSGGTFSSTAANQFSVRAAGGIVLAGDVSIAGGATSYHNLSLSGGNSYGFLYGSFPALGDGVHLGYNWYADNAGTPHVINTGGGTSRISADYGEIQLATGGVNATPVVRLDITTTTVAVENATFNGSASDRNVKQDFAEIDPAQILEKVVHLPVSEWSYKFETARRHIGPMAQDFKAAFNIGTDDRHIAPVDEGGIALAAIQGLNQKLDAKDAEIRELKANLAELKRRDDKDAEIRELRDSVAKLRELVEASAKKN